MAWYLAPSLAQLRTEINAAWPDRDHASDGSIGDADHSATVSDHNPNSRGSVDAIDVDEDGVSFAAIFAAVKRHPSARYVIYERRLYHRLRGWKPEAYSGKNPHDHHFHISIDQTKAAEQDRLSWGVANDTTTRSTTMIGLQKGDKGPEVQALQYHLKNAGFDPGDPDSAYGPKVSAAVLAMRKSFGSEATSGDTLTPAAYTSLMCALARKYAGKPGRDGKDGVVKLPMDVKITGTVTGA